MENETIDSPEKQFSEAISQKRKMTELLENENFKFFAKLLETQIEMRIHSMLIIPNGMDELIQRNYSSGEIAGLKIALNFPQVMIETLEGNIEMLKRGNENG